MNRYERQILLPEIGEEGQKKIQKGKVLIVGVGGLGSPLSTYLTASGVGKLGLMDDDVVSMSNLQRQILYHEALLGKEKVKEAKKRLLLLNSNIDIQCYGRLTKQNAESIIAQYDIVADGCDNYKTRQLISKTCKALNKPYVYGAIQGFCGQVSVFGVGNPAYYYEDLFDELPQPENILPTDKGVMGVTPGVIGTVEANEVLKLLVGYGNILSGKVWHIDLRTMQSGLLTW